MNTLSIGVVTIFPDVFHALDYSIPQRAQAKQLLALSYWNPRDYSHAKHHNVDDRPYGGGPGMVMAAQPLRDAIHAAKNQLGVSTPVIYLSPQGKTLTQQQMQTWSKQQTLLFVSGRYEGIDERIITTEIDEEWSLGDYILSGGELACMVVIDAISRLLPDAISNPESTVNDSFSQGLLDCPHYTRPAVINNQAVPEVLLTGDHQAIERWRLKQMLGKTWLKRPDLLTQRTLTSLEKNLLEEFKREQ